MDILPPLRQHPDPLTPRLISRSPLVTAVPGVPFPLHIQGVNHQLCLPPHLHPGNPFLLASYLQTGSQPAFQQPELNYTISNYIRTPTLGKGLLSSASFCRSTPSAQITPELSSTL